MRDERVLTRRALNRAILARQLLLERVAMTPYDAVHLLVGQQAQVPGDPYVGLWSRLRDFNPQELGKLIADRELVRAGLMRGTIHLVTVDDCLAMRPWVEPVMRRALTGSFGRFLREVDVDEIGEAGQALLEEQPRTRAELRQLLAERWPGVDETALVSAAAYLVPTVQIAPRGVWGSTMQPTLTTIQRWLGRPLDPSPDVEGIVLRYFAGYGPASVMDLQAWCGLTKLNEVVERLRPRLLSFRNESGRELFDVPEAPRPDAETPAPVRFLPEYDNVLLGLADRSRFMPGGEQLTLDVGMRSYGGVLVDGEYTAMWRIERANGTATMLVEQVAPLDDSSRQEVVDEAGRLLSFLTPDGAVQSVQLTRA